MRKSVTHFRGLLLALLTLAVATTSAQQWHRLSATDATQDPAHYARYTVDKAAFTAMLNNAGAEGSGSTEAKLTIPAPGGEVLTFVFEETKLLSGKAAETVPGVKTYTGVSTDKSTIIHLTVAPQLISGMALQNGRQWFVSTPVDPLQQWVEIYDMQGRPFLNNIPPCNSDGIQPRLPEPSSGGLQGRSAYTAPRACSLRIYRLALTGTADYTAYFGNAAAAYANTVALVNNVNAIYEREMNVRFTLVTSAALMYENGAAEPFTNSGATSCSELPTSHSHFLSMVGTNNFDVGMTLYGQNFGGCAYVGTVCNGSYKGGNVGGYNYPTPTSYLLEVMVHELGHQFGAGHTHNANSASCTATTTSSWEPGGGSSVMAYGTHCVPSYPDNSSIYFHGGSLGQMRTYISSGSGGCFVSGARNSTPTLTAATDNVFYIPISTPFRLSALASDSEDVNTLSYSFEQMDLGSGSSVAPSSTTATGPIIRSFEPGSRNYRYIPEMDSVLVNKVPVFESLPSISRNMRFWTTVRDNHAGCGCTAVDTIDVATSGTSPFRITSQSTAFPTTGGASFTVTWDVSGTTAAPFNTTQVRILFAADGYNYNSVLAAATANDGSETITLPNVITTKGRIMVAAVGNLFFDINDANITVQSACSGLQASQIFPEAPLTAPAGSAELQLQLSPSFGQPGDALNGEITSADPSGAVGGAASSTDSACTPSLSGRYDLFRFRVVDAGNYTVTMVRNTLGPYNYFALYNANGYMPGAPCSNYLFRSNNFYQNGSNYFYNYFSFSSPGNTVYNIAMANYGSGYGTYKLQVSGPGKIFTDVQNTSTGFGYVVVNAGGTIVIAGASSPDLRSLPVGSYTVYGISHNPGFNLGSYVNQPFSSLERGSFIGGSCVAVSNNRKDIVITTNVSLPLTYVRLKADRQATGNQLSWQVSDDDDVNGCVVEHSTDGSRFSPVATLKRHENRVAEGHYGMLHATTEGGTHYYRIRQLNRSGGFLYSNVAYVTNNRTAGITVSPNPTKGWVTVTTLRQDVFTPYQLQIFDNNGRMVKQVIISRPNTSIDLSALSPGIYLLSGNGVSAKVIRE